MDATFQTEVKHCHDFVQMISELIILTKPEAAKTSQDFLDIAKELCQVTRGRTEQEVRYNLRDMFPVERVGEKAQTNLGFFKLLLGIAANLTIAGAKIVFWNYTIGRPCIEASCRIRLSGSISVLHTRSDNRACCEIERLKSPNSSNVRLQVIDLPSIDDPRFRDLTVDALLELEWKRARRNWHEALKKSSRDDERVPTFIVVDEAHNLLPFHAETPLKVGCVSVSQESGCRRPEIWFVSDFSEPAPQISWTRLYSQNAKTRPS